MKMKKALLSCTVLFALVLAQTVLAQSVGKIYSKTTADSLFGNVINSVEINSNKLQSLTSNTSNYIMFNIVQGNLVVLNNNRNVLYPGAMTISSSTVFKFCSVSVLLDLMREGGNASTYIEIRQNVLTVTNGDFTLEEMENCPPFCP